MADEPLDTETKIKEAAQKVFLANGYEGAKIRQIADEAGVNVALVNYYFRSKEQLFQQIYFETFSSFLGVIAQLLNEETPFEVKVWKLVDRYTDFLLANPLMPMFVLSEYRQSEQSPVRQLKMKEMIRSTVFMRQLNDEIEAGNFRKADPFQVIFSMIGSLVFPFIARPVVTYVGSFTDDTFSVFVNERKQVIPEMIMAYLRVR